MLLKIDTPLWRRNPYLFSSDTWGVIYVVHGMAAMTIVAIVIIHIYFTLIPDNGICTRSMFRGWISRKDYSKASRSSALEGVSVNPPIVCCA